MLFRSNNHIDLFYYLVLSFPSANIDHSNSNFDQLSSWTLPFDLNNELLEDDIEMEGGLPESLAMDFNYGNIFFSILFLVFK